MMVLLMAGNTPRHRQSGHSYQPSPVRTLWRGCQDCHCTDNTQTRQMAYSPPSNSRSAPYDFTATVSRPECQQERDIGLETAWPLNGVASRKQEMRGLTEIVYSADIEFGI